MLLDRQLAEKNEKQQAMRADIEALREEMKAADTRAVAMAAVGGAAPGDDAQLAEQSAKLKQQVDELQGKLEKLRSKQKEVQKQLDEERERYKVLEKDKEGLEVMLRTQTTDLRKAERQKREASDMVKQLKEAADSDAKRIGELEKKMREADRASSLSRPASRRGADGGGDGDGGGGGREEATRRWEAEKRLESKVERLTGKLKEHRREFEAMESQHAAEKERHTKEVDKLRLRVDQLEDDKKQLKARLRGAGAPVDSDDVLARVRDAERRVLELQEHNERLTRDLNVDKRIKTDNERHAREELDRQLRLTKEELESKEQQLRVALEDKSNAILNERSKEVRRLETAVSTLRAREEGLEGDLLAAQNEIVRLRFESEHSELRLQRWQRRVRELESLPLAVGKAELPDKAGGGGKRKTKEDEEMERFVRSTKTALDKLHRENENLRANSASNAKYMDVVKESKMLKQALADRDREIVTLTDKLNGLKEQMEKKAKIDEKCRSLERQLKGLDDNCKNLQSKLSDKERLVLRLESEVAAARESAGHDGMINDRVREVTEEKDRLDDEAKKYKRAVQEANNKLAEANRQIGVAQKRATEFENKYEEALKAKPTGRQAHDERSASQEELKKMRDELSRVRVENEELKGELNCFDPAFFDEIEDLKYNHNEMSKLVDRYETLLQHLSQKYNFDFTPQGSMGTRRK
jgi:centrosomal protein CEP290